MTTLQKFKLLATQCGVAQSPTRSPRTSPLVNFRRPKTTLRMLLTRTGSRKSREMPFPQSFVGVSAEKKKADKDLSGRTLKDLFVSSPSLEGEGDDEQGNDVKENFGGGKSEAVLATKLVGVNGLDGEPGSPRPGWIGFRHRMLLRRAWRPMLQTIVEPLAEHENDIHRHLAQLRDRPRDMAVLFLQGAASYGHTTISSGILQFVVSQLTADLNVL